MSQELQIYDRRITIKSPVATHQKWFFPVTAETQSRTVYEQLVSAVAETETERECRPIYYHLLITTNILRYIEGKKWHSISNTAVVSNVEVYDADCVSLAHDRRSQNSGSTIGQWSSLSTRGEEGRVPLDFRPRRTVMQKSPPLF